tara:strand:+ start:156 stop:575 length:420 start_codon:yes stop_codon:yes gene_type:complete
MSKILTTIALIGGGILPLFVDISAYHLLNPDWDSHARVHEAWRLSTNFCIFSLGIYLLWIKQKEMLSAMLSICILFGFIIAAISMPLYGGTPVGKGIIEPYIMGIPFNVLFFSTMLITQLIAIVLVIRGNITQENIFKL